MDAAHYGHLAGATDIVFHPGSAFGDRDDALRTAIPRLRGCLKELEKAKNPVRLRPETMGKSAQLGSIDDILTINQALPQIEPCLDFAHLHARAGDGSCNTYDEWSRILERLAQNLQTGALQRIHCHLQALPTQAKVNSTYDAAGSDLNLSALLKALQRSTARQDSV